MTLESYLVAAFAVVLTGISKSGFAGGLGIVGVPLVALTMSLQAARSFCSPSSLGSISFRFGDIGTPGKPA